MAVGNQCFAKQVLPNSNDSQKHQSIDTSDKLHPSVEVCRCTSGGALITFVLYRKDLAKKQFKHHSVAFFSFLALVLLTNWPLVLHLRTHIIGRIFEDAFEVLWQLSWMETAVFELKTNPFFAPSVYYPQGWYVASGAQPSWYFLLLAPFTHFLGVVATYNLMLLSTFILAGFGTYLLAYQLTEQRLPSIIAGWVYISAPVLTLRLGGHAHTLFSMMFLPYATLSFYHVFQQQQRRWHWILLASISLALTILGLWYFLFIATLPLLGFSLLVSKNINYYEWAMRLTAIGTLTLLIILPAATLTWQARQEMFPERGDFPLAASDSFSMSPNYLFLPNPNHPLWGEWSSSYFQVSGEQNFVFVGYTALVLVSLGVWFTPWQDTRAFVAMGAIAIVLALGLTLHWHNERILLSLSPSISKLLQPLFGDIPLEPNQLPIPLPGLFLYHLLPFYGAMRVWTRFAIPLMLALATLSGYGAVFLAAKGRHNAFVFIIMGLLVIFEGLMAPYKHFTDVAHNNRSANKWLANQPANVVIIEYPRSQVDKIAMYSQSLHRQQVVNGYMSIEPDFLQRVSLQLGEWPNANALPILREWNVQYLLVSGRTASEAFQNDILPDIDLLDGLCHVQSFDDGFMHFDQTHIYHLVAADETCPDD